MKALVHILSKLPFRIYRPLAGIAPKLFASVFYPEEDFYLDEAGDPVFYFQAGSIAPAEEGVLRFPIPLEDLLDEL